MFDDAFLASIEHLVIWNALILKSVATLPSIQPNFTECKEIGCAVNAVRLNKNGREYLAFCCPACKHILIYEKGRGWHLKLRSRAEIAQARQHTKERNTPEVGKVWKNLQRMQKQEQFDLFTNKNASAERAEAF